MNMSAGKLICAWQSVRNGSRLASLAKDAVFRRGIKQD